MDFNKIILKGRVGKDPEVKNLKFGDIVELSVATSDSWKDKESGEWKNNTSWHKVVCKGDYATKYASKYIKKGANVMIEGKQENRTYEKDGVKRVSPEVVVGPFGGLIMSTDPNPNKSVESANQSNGSSQVAKSDSSNFDDEIPF